jgi:hypothetical protein
MKTPALAIALALASAARLAALDFAPSVPATIDAASRDVAVADRIVAAGARQQLLAEYYKVLEMRRDLVRIELHFGMLANSYHSGGLGSYAIGDDTLGADSMGLCDALLYKWNVLNPKYPYAGRILSKIDLIDELARQNGIELSAEARARLDEARGAMERYLDEGRFKRLAVGIGMPVADNVNRGPFSTYARDTFFFAAYDLYDTVSVVAGCNFYLNRPFLGLSVDVSTPAYQLGQGFVNVLKALFLPQAQASQATQIIN